MSTNQISKPVEDSNTEENKIKEFENWIVYFFIEKESDADAVWHFFICYGSLSTTEATYSKRICYFTPGSSSFSHFNSSALQDMGHFASVYLHLW